MSQFRDKKSAESSLTARHACQFDSLRKKRMAIGKTFSFRAGLSQLVVSYRFTTKDGTKVVFREPRRTDAKLLMDFINPFVTEQLSGILIDSKVNLKGERQWLSGWMSDINRRKGVMLSAEMGGRIVGNCTVSRMIWKQSHRAAMGIAVSKEMRGKGIGEELMKRTIDLARKRLRGLEMIELSVLAYNKKASGLYKKLGFMRVGRMPDSVKEGREYFDEFVMVRYL